MTMNFRALMTIIVFITIFQGCSGSGSLSSESKGTRTYDKPFSFIEKAVRGAIKGTGVEIGGMSKSVNPNKLTLELVRNNYSTFTATPEQPGSITILEKGTSKTQVKIENPEYDRSTPPNHRFNFQITFFPRIEKLIEINL